MNKYGHWILVILVGISFIPGIAFFEFSLSYVMAMIFGIIGFSAVLYMAIVTQKKQSKE
ncbi:MULTISPECIES: hypothetical protein [Bacillaceae]|uniref:hypothetical protein n=1 Tax=Bacillaceae TaxID=186817 RepID=UPI0015DF5DE4|nr:MULTISPECIES: hypothetical protein [Bacillaceae]